MLNLLCNLMAAIKVISIPNFAPSSVWEAINEQWQNINNRVWSIERYSTLWNQENSAWNSITTKSWY